MQEILIFVGICKLYARSGHDFKDNCSSMHLNDIFLVITDIRAPEVSFLPREVFLGEYSISKDIQELLSENDKV
jgi:hypothetical protein